MTTTTPETLPSVWSTHEHGVLAKQAAACPANSRERIAALRTLALRCGFAPLSWSNEQLERLLTDGPAPDVANTVTVEAEVDYERVRRIAAEEAAKLIPPRERVVVHGKASKAEVECAHKALFDVVVHLNEDHVYIVGPAGSGKTTLAEQVAKLLRNAAGGVGVPFYSSGAVYRESRLLGYTFPKADGTVGVVRTDFREAFEHGGLFLLDEIDASDANALVAFNQALANGSCAFPDGKITAHPDFRCIASANTFGGGGDRKYVGRNALDKATLDRFAFIEIDYDEDIELRLAEALGDVDWCKRVQALRRGAAKAKVEHLITPRATLKGAKLIAAYVASGIEREDAIERVLKSVVWKGLNADKIAAVKAAAY